MQIFRPPSFRSSPPRGPHFGPWRALLTLLLLLPLWSACDAEREVTTVSEDYLDWDADGIVFGMTHRITQDGRLQGLVRADTAIQWNDSASWHLRGVDLTVLEESGAERATVTALRGILDTRTNRMTAHGDVVLVIPGQDRRVESEALNYDPQGDRIWSDSAFVHRHRGQVTRGRAFTSDLEFRNFTILGRGGS
jgi:LPS export ABC transporter protein LptC